MEIKVKNNSLIKDFDRLTITKNSDNTYSIAVEKGLVDAPELMRIFTIPKVRLKNYEIVAEVLSPDERHNSIPTILTIINEKTEDKKWFIRKR